MKSVTNSSDRMHSEPTTRYRFVRKLPLKLPTPSDNDEPSRDEYEPNVALAQVVVLVYSLTIWS
jgi:hypothetical protein